MENTDEVENVAEMEKALEHLEAVKVWIEKQGYRIVAIDYFIYAVYNTHLFSSYQPFGGKGWKQDLYELINSGTIADAECAA